MLEDRDWCGGVAPWCVGVDCCHGLVAVELLEAGAANYCYVDWSCGEVSWEQSGGGGKCMPSYVLGRSTIVVDGRNGGLSRFSGSSFQ